MYVKPSWNSRHCFYILLIYLICTYKHKRLCVYTKTQRLEITSIFVFLRYTIFFSEISLVNAIIFNFSLPFKFCLFSISVQKRLHRCSPFFKKKNKHKNRLNPKTDQRIAISAKLFHLILQIPDYKSFKRKVYLHGLSSCAYETDGSLVDWFSLYTYSTYLLLAL